MLKVKNKLSIIAASVLSCFASSAALAQSQSVVYDNQGRLLKTIGGSAVTQVEYDTNRGASTRVKRIFNSGVLKEEYNYWSIGSDVLTQRSSSKSSENYLTDGAGRYFGESSVEKGGISVVLNADNTIQKITDARGFETNFSYNDFSAVTSAQSSDFGATFTYGAQGAPGAGQIVSAQKSGAYGTVLTNYSYNKSGLLLSKSQTVTTLEESGSAVLGVSYTYAGGKLSSVTYPSGAVVTYQYSGDVVSRVLLNGNTLLDNVVFTAAVNYGSVAQGAFTSWDGVYSQGSAAGAPLVPYRVGVDNAGNITSYSFGGLVGGQWGARSLTWNTEKMNPRLATRNSAPTALSTYGVQDSYSYDVWDHVVSASTAEALNGVGVKNIVNTYNFNSNNGLSGQTRTVSGDTSSVMSAITASNSDRPLSARIWNKQKQVFEDQNYSYDASGNLVSISATSSTGSYVMTFNWNSQGQLVGMTNSNPALSLYPDAGVVAGIASASYYYDANGARVKKVTKDANGALMLSTGFLYSDHDTTKVLVEYTLNYEANRVPSSYGNFSSKEYVYLPNPQTGVLTPAAMLKQSNAGLEVFYLMPDQLGSVQTVVQARNVVDGTGQSVNNTAFVAYSTALGDSKVFYRDDFSKNGGFNLRAPGQYLDIETGLLYNNARYFNPWIGAFISADPIGKNGGTNVYAYGVGSLINDVDDSGLSVDINHFHPFHSPIQYEYSKYMNKPEYFIYAAHMSANRLQIEHIMHSKFRTLKIEDPSHFLEFVNEIKNHPNYHGQPIVLMGCHSAPWAKKLSETLNTLVMGYPDFAWFSSYDGTDPIFPINQDGVEIRDENNKNIITGYTKIKSPTGTKWFFRGKELN